MKLTQSAFSAIGFVIAGGLGGGIGQYIHLSTGNEPAKFLMVMGYTFALIGSFWLGRLLIRGEMMAHIEEQNR